MKSLEERKAYRKQQRADNAKVAKEAGLKPPSDGSTLGGSGDFDAEKTLAGDAKKLTGNLSSFDDEQLAALEESEEAGKKRANVLSAIKAERSKKAAAGSGWTGN